MGRAERVSSPARSHTGVRVAATPPSGGGRTQAWHGLAAQVMGWGGMGWHIWVCQVDPRRSWLRSDRILDRQWSQIGILLDQPRQRGLLAVLFSDLPDTLYRPERPFS